MRKDSVRKIGSSLLAGTLLVGTIGFFPLNSAAQTTVPTKQDEKQNKKDKKKTASNKQNAPTTAQTAPTTDSKSPLSVKEDPSQIGKRNINGGSDKFFGWLGGSKDREIAIGRQLATEVEQQAKLVDDPIVTEYINRIGQNIVLHSDAKVPFTIKVIDTDEVNAFALPGGFFYVNKGLILAADNEAELAGVMAHEIAHVCARHAMENQGKGTAMNYGMLAGIIFGGPIIGTVLQNGGGILGGLTMLKFSRGAETEADNLGVQYLYASGYDPTAMAAMFEKLASQNKKKPGSVAKLFSSHPQSLDRRDSSLSLVARFPEKEEYVISTSEFQRVKAHLLRLSNVKAGVTGDIDDADAGKPTLKRRQPEPDSTAPDTDGSSSSSKDAPPKLKKRGEEPTTPQPSPSPEK
ncbi:MAG: M48 family metallopeptidase [Acidobacteriota bacterium]|nr:M48 family metallopeptidase [Acidobacteriota bacterium]